MPEWRKLADVADIRRGSSPRPISDPKYFGDGRGWIRISDVTRAKRFLRETDQYLSRTGEALSVKVDHGDLIMSICGTIGRPVIVDMPACIHDGFVKFGNVRDAEIPYLYYALSHAERALNGMGQPGTQSNLNTALVGQHQIFTPERDEQLRVTEILGTLDEAIEQTEALVAKMLQVKAGMMHDLFTRGVTPDGRLRPTRSAAPHLYREVAGGWLPSQWDCVLLDDIATRGSGHTPNQSKAEYWNGSVKWISLADSWRLDRLYISETEKTITSEGIANSSAVIHPPKTVVLSRDAGVGKSAIMAEPMAVSQHFMAWRCGDGLEPHYLYYWLQREKRRFEGIATGTTIPTIGLSFFKRYRISVPLLPAEQELIGRVGVLFDEQLFSLEAELTKLRQIKSGLMHDLLTGGVRVKPSSAA